VNRRGRASDVTSGTDGPRFVPAGFVAAEEERMRRPFRFGVVTGNAQSRAEWVAKARRAEALGYATLLVPDHLVIGIAPMTALAVAAEATASLRIGGLVFCNDYRHPAWLAKEAATLDLLSDGRFELGMGAGYLQAEYAQAGIPFDRPGARVGRLDEALRIMKRLFTEETVTFAGEHYRITGLQGRPKPIQQPHPPIFVGAMGKRLLAVAARHADSIGIGFTVWRSEVTPIEPAEVARKVAWVREAAGERFEALELGYTVFRVMLIDGQAAADAPESPHVLAGSVDQIVEEISTRREQYGFSYIQVMEREMEAFAPVVARLAGA
jgi:probable F420-dependent oxidoreductase